MLGQTLEKTEAAGIRELGGSVIKGKGAEPHSRQCRRPRISRDVHGVVITSVDDSIAAAPAGLQRGEVIQEVDRKPVRNVAEFHRALAGAHGPSVLLLVSRDGSSSYVVVESQ